MSREYHALNSGVGFVELPPRTVVELTGEDRASLLHNLCTADVKRLRPGQGTEAFLTDVKGHVLAHLFILCRTDSMVLDTTGDQAEALIPHLDRYIIREDVQVHNRSDEFTHLLVSGEDSASCVREVLGNAPTEMLGHVGDDSLVVRSPMAIPPNFLVRLPMDAKPAVPERLKTAGAIACGLETLEALRIEAGFPVYGKDITEQNLPQEVGRDAQAISFSKGCYLGQETVARLDAMGHVNWRLAGLRGDPSSSVGEGSELKVNGDVVARVGSAAFSPKYDAPLILAYVRVAYAKPETELQTTLGRFVVEFVVG